MPDLPFKTVPWRSRSPVLQFPFSVLPQAPCPMPQALSQALLIFEYR